MYLQKSKSTVRKLLPGFTLVELIVVITILAILGTIGFISIQGYSSSARDSERISDLTNLSKGFEIFLSKGGTLPQPDPNMFTLTASGTPIGYQGYAGTRTLTTLSLGGKFQDPISNQYYTYSTNANQSKYQILGLLENGDNISLSLNDIIPGIDQAYAGSYESRFPITKGSSLGILIGTGANLNQPVQELVTATFTGVDVVTTNTGYTAIFSKNNTLYGSGTVLKSMRAGGALASGLVGYWSFDDVGSKVFDNSGKRNSGTCYYTTGATTNCGTIGQGPQFVTGKLGLSMSGAGLVIPMFPELKSTNLTISFWVKSTKTATGYFAIINQWDCSSGTCQVPNEAPWWFGISNNGGVSTPMFISSGSGWNATIGPENGHYNLPIQGDNIWHLFTIVKVSTVISLYMDGAKFATQRNSVETINSNYPLYIGRSGHTNDSNENSQSAGLVDEVRIYNIALSDSDIMSLYTSTK